MPEGDLYMEAEFDVRATRRTSTAWVTPGAVGDIVGARVLALLGDSVTTDHISPAGTIASRARRGST